MTKRSISNKQRAWLEGEVKLWQAQDYLTQEQGSRIMESYDSKEDIAERQHGKALQTLLGAAALMAGMGVLLLVGYNWEALHPVIKLLLIFGVTLGTHLAGLQQLKRGDRRVAEALFFLGCLFFGAGIWLIAQVFHINAHWPDGLWWWALGVLPFALALDSAVLHVLYAGLLAAWCGSEMLGFPGSPGWFFGRWSFIPNRAWTLPLLVLPGMIAAYRSQSVPKLSANVLALSWWTALFLVRFDVGEETLFFVGVVGGLLLVAAGFHRAGNPMAKPYRVLGSLLSASMLIAPSFHEFNSHHIFWAASRNSNIPVAVAAVIALLVCMLYSRARWLMRREGISMGDAFRAALKGQIVASAIVLFMAFLACWRALVSEPLVPTILANVAMLALAGRLVRTGLQEDSGRAFGAGVAYFLLWAVLRYADLFGKFGGMPGAAAMFLFCAVILFTVARHWRRRKAAN